jgi:protocatechuate 3,4-dioxygenase beta subunit
LEIRFCSTTTVGFKPKTAGAIGFMISINSYVLHVTLLLAIALVASTDSSTAIAQDPAQQKTAPPAPAKAAERQKQAAPPGTRPKPQTHPIIVTGMATDDLGVPIKGATVHLISTNGNDVLLDVVKSDENGVYKLEGQLPIYQGPGITPQGTIQVFGLAPGHGFAWHELRFVLLAKRPAVNNSTDSFFEGEPLLMNLVFAPEALLRGRVVDEAGRPIEGVGLRIDSCDYLEVDRNEGGVNSRRIRALYMLPEAHRTATTGPDGKFTFTGVPPEMIFWLRCKHSEFAQLYLYAATTHKPLPENIDMVVHRPDTPKPAIATGDIKLTLVKPRRIQLQVLSEDRHEPVARAEVFGSSDQATGSGASGKTDSKGRVELALPPGDFHLDIRPQIGSNYLRGNQKIQVDGDLFNQTKQVLLKPGCVVLLEAIDTNTGKGIPAVGFRHGPLGLLGSVERSDWYVENARTDADGRIRALLTPGQDDFFINPVEGYEPEKASIRQVELPAGKTVTVQFKLKKKAL